jgi:hypothetical protein
MNRLSISPENEILHSFHHQVQNDHDAGRLHSTGLGVGFRHDIDRHEGEIRDDGLPCSADADTTSLHILSEWVDNLCCVMTLLWWVIAIMLLLCMCLIYHRTNKKGVG